MKKLVDFTITHINKKILSSNYRTNNLLSNYLEILILLNKQTSFLCTLSGGQDSILTFFLLVHTEKKDYLQLLYCQHLWQIKNFFSARFIFQMSYLIQVPYTLILPQDLFLTENESRTWRKKNFFRFSQIEHIPTSFTGHTETDTLEQNLNHLFRGTSPAGLSSSHFLKSQNKVILFFSSINLNTCFFCKLERWRNFSQDLIFTKQKNKNNQTKRKRGNKKASSFLTKRINITEKNFSKSMNFCNGRSNPKKILIKNQRKTFQYTKSIKTFNQSVFFLFNFNCVEQKNYKRIQNPLVSQTSRKKLSLSTPNYKVFGNNQILFHFLDSTQYLLKRQKKDIVKQQKSYSFCFSNHYFNMREKLIKPLEKTTRFSVSKLVNLYNLPTLIDVTNFSSNFSRNNIRHQLIPFIRCLVHLNIEFLLINFFKMIYQEHQDREKEIYEIYYLSTILNNQFTKKRTKLKPLVNLGSMLLEKKSTKRLIKTISENQAKSFFQKLFFEYKNLKLNYSQIVKLQEFY